MNLVIDVGNTLVKLAVFSENFLQYKKTCIKTEFLPTLTEITENHPQLSHCIVSSVVNLSSHQLGRLQRSVPVYEINEATSMPFKNSYGTPKTLGTDRLALMSAASCTYPKRNVLVIDAGSAITYDFLSAENEYLGGAISPGIVMRYKALHTFTAKLPLLDIGMPKNLIGNTTTASIHSGVIHGVLFEMKGFIASYSQNYTDLTIILTGGDAHFLRDSLKNDIFANSNFLLEGLNYILEHNKDRC